MRSVSATSGSFVELVPQGAPPLLGGGSVSGSPDPGLEPPAALQPPNLQRGRDSPPEERPPPEPSVSDVDLPGDFKRTSLTIGYRDVSMTVQVPKASGGYTTLISPLTTLAKAVATCGENLGTRAFHRLDSVSGVLRPGTMTLVLAPPGHGKSTFLKVLSSRLTASAGTIVYNGLTSEEAARDGCNTRRLTQYVDQIDEHLPLLTVTETLDFAHRVTCARYDPARVENTVKLLGLEECKDTILGNAMLRGVSGGQKRRVTLGEMLVGDACALFLDEYTNGLDTATSEDITRGLRQWTAQTNGLIVTSLQQPTPGLYAMFDNIIVLRDAQIVYDGPREDLEPFFASMGFNCPDDVDVCDFIIDCVSQPRVALQRLQNNERSAAKAAAAAGAAPPAAAPHAWQTTCGELRRAPAPCVTTAQMVAHYKASPAWARNIADLGRVLPPSGGDANSSADPGAAARACEPLMPSTETQRMYKTGYTLSQWTLFAAVLRRQWTGVARNSALAVSRLVQTAVMGLLYGSLYWQIPREAFVLRVSVFLISQIQVVFGSLAELPLSVGGNRLVFKQAGASFYPTYMYALATTVCGLPVSLAETAVLSLLLYFMTDCVHEAGRFFVFYAVTFMTMIFLAVWMRLLSSLARDEGAANALAGPSTGMFNMFGGFFVTMDSLPVWMRWVMWLSPMYWSVSALCNNEFLSPRYSEITDDGSTLGELYLRTLQIRAGNEWIGFAILYLFGLCLVCTALYAYMLWQPEFEASIGTTRFDEGHELIDTDADAATADAVAAGADADADAPADAVAATAVAAADAEISSVRRAAGGGLETLSSAVPLHPTWVTFSDIHYTVKVPGPDGKELVDRPLLRGVNGYAEPGKLTALMGASGAGKTTLLDVLAGRKNTGVVEGKILFNGRVPTAKDFARATCYVEQFDSLLSTDTVRETLAFAAHLRLPADVAFAVKERVVDEVLAILDLASIADNLIGNVLIPGLSPSQLKRVSIGCELVANPSVLFLDEPTTGLDSRAAQTVMRVVRRIALSGRSVICTIHQPSAELFYLFDRLVLLASGGHQVFFGDLGTRSKRFVKYLETVPKVKPIPARYNPASWMLEELGVGVSGAKAAGAEQSDVLIARFKLFFERSTVRARAMARIRAIEGLGSSMQGPDSPEGPVSVCDGGALAHPAGEEHEHDSDAEPSVSRAGSQRAGGSGGALPSEIGEIRHALQPSVAVQLAAVLARTLRGTWRSPQMLMAVNTALLILSLLFGCMYFQLSLTSQSAATSLVAALTVAPMFGAVTQAGGALPTKMLNRSVFYRETSSDMYRPALWAVAGFLSDLVCWIPSVLILVLPMYFMAGHSSEPGAFFKFLFAVYVTTIGFITVASVVAASTPNIPTATVVQGLFFSVSFIFAGINIPYPQVPRGYIFLYRGLPLSHLTEALVMPQFATCSPMPECTPLIEVVDGTHTVLQPAGVFIERYLGFGFDGYWDALGWAWLFFTVPLILCFWATAKVRFDKR